MGTENYSNKKTSFDMKRKDIHSNELGMEVPKDYFSNSKNQILKKVGRQKRSKLVLFVNRKSFLTAAASMAALFVLTIYHMKNEMQQKQIIVAENSIELNLENEQLLTSLFLEKDLTEDVVDIYVTNEILLELD